MKEQKAKVNGNIARLVARWNAQGIQTTILTRGTGDKTQTQYIHWLRVSSLCNNCQLVDTELDEAAGKTPTSTQAAERTRKTQWIFSLIFEYIKI